MKLLSLGEFLPYSQFCFFGWELLDLWRLVPSPSLPRVIEFASIQNVPPRWRRREGEGYFLDGPSLFMIALHMISRRYILLLILEGEKSFFFVPFCTEKREKVSFASEGKMKGNIFSLFLRSVMREKECADRKRQKNGGKRCEGWGWLVGAIRFPSVLREREVVKTE